jgi:hypothetical protein
LLRTAKIALGCLFFCGLPTAAQANGLLLIGPQIGSSLLMLLGSGSHCTVFAYDPNGNRLSQGSSAVGSGAAVWGTDMYGCAVWGQ